MRMTFGRKLSIAGLALGLSIVSAGPANAARLVVDDSRGDVWSPRAGAPGYDFVGGMVNTDVLSTVVAHRATNITVKVQYVALRKRKSDEIDFTAWFRTDEKRIYQVQAQMDWLGRSTYFVVTRGINQFRVDCPGVHGRARFDLDTLRIVVPRSCLSSPQWVRFAGTAESYEESTGLFIDDATSDRANGDWSRRIRHG